MEKRLKTLGSLELTVEKSHDDVFLVAPGAKANQKILNLKMVTSTL